MQELDARKREIDANLKAHQAVLEMAIPLIFRSSTVERSPDSTKNEALQSTAVEIIRSLTARIDVYPRIVASAK